MFLTTNTGAVAHVQTSNYGVNCMIFILFQVKKLRKGGRAVVYSPDGSTVAVGQNDGGFLILDAVTLEKIVGFKDRKEEISDVKFSPGKQVFVLRQAHAHVVFSSKVRFTIWASLQLANVNIGGL